MKWLIFVLPVLFAGCVNIDTHTQPINQTVKAVAIGEDCSLIIFGFGYGINTVERAMANGRVFRNPERPQRSEPMAITRIHSIVLQEGGFLVFGWRCVKVEGE